MEARRPECGPDSSRDFGSALSKADMSSLLARRAICSTLLAMLLGCCAATARAQHQTDTFSPIALSGGLDVRLSRVDFGDTTLPTLHSAAKAVYDGQWVMVAGRTNGMHGIAGFDFSGLSFFPPS